MRSAMRFYALLRSVTQCPGSTWSKSTLLCAAPRMLKRGVGQSRMALRLRRSHGAQCVPSVRRGITPLAADLRKVRIDGSSPEETPGSEKEELQASTSGTLDESSLAASPEDPQLLAAAMSPSLSFPCFPLPPPWMGPSSAHCVLTAEG